MKNYELQATSFEDGSSASYKIIKFDSSAYAERYIKDLGLKLHTSTDAVNNSLALWIYKNGGRYNSDPILKFSRTGTYPDYKDETCWMSQQSYASDAQKLAEAKANAAAALKDGFFVNILSGFFYSSYGATLYLQTYQGVVTPTGKSPTSGNLSRGMRYLLQWTTDAEDDTERSNLKTWIDIQYADGSNAKTIQLSNGATQYLLDTADWRAASAIRWRVRVTAYMSGTQTASPWYTLSLVDADGSISDMRPTGNTYYGFDQFFSWSFTAKADSNAVGSGIKQASAAVQYRTTQMVTPKTIGSVAGDTTYVVIHCGDIPVGSYEWRVVVTSNFGGTYTSGWQSCTNVEVELQIEDMRPAEGAYAPRHIANRFSWSMTAKKDDVPGVITQRSAVFYWRNGSAGSWTAVQVTGNNKYVDIPAGTFGSGKNVQWYVVATASTGSKVTSDIVTVVVDDALSTPVTVSPSGVYLDDTVTGITFAWTHANATGTVQCGWELSYSQDSGASYTVLASGNDAADHYTAAPKTFVSGTVYWRVRTKNTDGVYGSYSGAAVFAIRHAPDAPLIVYCDNKPMLTIRWQSAEQAAYEVELDGQTQGLRYGTEKTWQNRDVLADGSYTLRVRIVNVFGDRSAWSEITAEVENKPHGTVQLQCSERWAEVLIAWHYDAESQAAYLLRDGQPIAKALSEALADRETAAAHSYTVRVFDADGYYTDSVSVMAAPSIPYGAIGLQDADEWQLLKYRPKQDIYSRSTAKSGTMQQYWGHDRPVWHDYGFETITHEISYSYQDIADAEALREMRGQNVIYKDCDGHLAIGIFDKIDESGSASTTCTLKITEVEREAVQYDPV